MDERETRTEIRSVFGKAMKEDSHFSFSILHPIGGGSKCLTIPRMSTSFAWSAKEVCKAAGRGAIYILAEDDLAHHEVVQLSDLSDHESNS